MNTLLKIFDSRRAGIICFLFAVANRVIFTSLYSAIGRDTKLQLSYAENLMAGQGMGIAKYFTTDLNTPVFDTYQLFPPGFSLSIIPLLKLYNGDEYLAVLAFDIIAAILFIVSVRMLAKKAGLPFSFNNIITLIVGCSQYPFFMSWSSTDVVSLSFVLIAFSVMIGLTTKNHNSNFLQVSGLGFLFFLPTFFRFMYLPVTIILPILLLLYGAYVKNKLVRTNGLKLFAVVLLLSVALFSFIILYSGSGYHLYTTERGIFVEQVIHWYPFLPASFINLDFAAQLMAKLPRLDYAKAMSIFGIINIILFILLMILFARYFFSYKNKPAFPVHFTFIVAGSGISILVLLMLAWFSLTYKSEDWGNYKWTHVRDVRYYAFIYVFMPMLVFTCLYYYSAAFKRLLPRIFITVGLLFFSIEILHGIYYNAKIILRHNDLAIVRDMGKDYKSFPGIINQIKKQNPGREVLVSAPDQYFLLTASQLGCKALFDYQNLNHTDLKVTVKSILIVPVNSDDASFLNKYVGKKKPELISNVSGTSFYIQEIDP